MMKTVKTLANQPIGSRLKNAANKAKETIETEGKKAYTKAKSKVKSNPIKSGAIAGGVGGVAASEILDEDIDIEELMNKDPSELTETEAKLLRLLERKGK